jgi:hypothetical protein
MTVFVLPSEGQKLGSALAGRLRELSVVYKISAWRCRVDL